MKDRSQKDLRKKNLKSHFEKNKKISQILLYTVWSIRDLLIYFSNLNHSDSSRKLELILENLDGIIKDCGLEVPSNGSIENQSKIAEELLITSIDTSRRVIATIGPSVFNDRISLFLQKNDLVEIVAKIRLGLTPAPAPSLASSASVSPNSTPDKEARRLNDTISSSEESMK